MSEGYTDVLRAPDGALNTVPDESQSTESTRPSLMREAAQIHAEAIELTKAARLRAAG